MTLLELAQWHAGERDRLYKQSDASFQASQDGRASPYTRQMYAQDCNTCIDLARWHGEAYLLLVATIA